MRRPSAVRAVLVCSRWSRAWIWSLFDSTCAEQNRKKEKKNNSQWTELVLRGSRQHVALLVYIQEVVVGNNEEAQKGKGNGWKLPSTQKIVSAKAPKIVKTKTRHIFKRKYFYLAELTALRAWCSTSPWPNRRNEMFLFRFLQPLAFTIEKISTGFVRMFQKPQNDGKWVQFR